MDPRIIDQVVVPTTDQVVGWRSSGQGGHGSVLPLGPCGPMVIDGDGGGIDSGAMTGVGRGFAARRLTHPPLYFASPSRIRIHINPYCMTQFLVGVYAPPRIFFTRVIFCIWKLFL